jgi:signal transduction histidine kinase
MQALQLDSPLTLRDDQDTYLVAEYAEVYVDETADLTFDQVVSNGFTGEFKPLNQADTSSGESAYWVRLDIENLASPAVSWLMLYDNNNTNQISAYLPKPQDAGFREIHTGNTFPFSSREYEYHYYVFELKTPSGEKGTVYLRLYDVGGVRLGSLQIQSLARFSQTTASDGFWDGGYYAVILTILLYNILFLTSLKERGGLNYILLVASILLVSLTSDGYGHQYLWRNWTLWADKGLLTSIAFLLVALVYYALNTLDVKEHFPRWALASKIVIVGMVTVVFLRMADAVDQDLLTPPLMIFFMAGFTLPVALALKMRILRPRQSALIITAFAILVALILWNTVALALGFDLPQANTITRTPFIWLLFVFAFATNDHIREIREQREQVQRELVAEQREALRVKTELIEELEGKNSELERFTYTVSHDLRSPLVTIKGFLGFIEQGIATGNTARLKNDMQRISDAVGKMQSLLNDLLELSRIGRMMNAPTDIPLADLVKDAMDNVHGQLEARRVTVLASRQPNLPIVHGDRQRLTEVLQNLLENAVKYMGDQTDPRIEIGQRGEENDKPIFFLKDNGIGIAPEYHERIFGLFNKLDPLSEGTGVGLALVKRIIEVHGGRLWVESEAGKGSTFYFTLPRG